MQTQEIIDLARECGVIRAADVEAIGASRTLLPYLENKGELPVAFTPEFLEAGFKETQWEAFLRRSSLSSFGLDLATVLADLKKSLWPLLAAPER